jgi:sugar lactone lactonase YvrE
MGERQLHPLLEGGSFFEGPRWHAGRWYVSDFYRHTVFAIEPDGTETAIAEVPGQPSGLGFLPDGTLLIVSMKDHRVVRQDGSTYADLSEYAGGPLNDMAVDAQGRAYVGNFGFDLMNSEDPRATSLVRIDPDGSTRAVAQDLWFPNGTVITGDTMIVAETFAGRLTAFTLDDGNLTDRRVWGQIAPAVPPAPLAEMLPQLGFAPDGIALDADHHVWVADGLGGPTCRIAPGGEIVDEIKLPDGLGAFACSLGGSDGKTLLLCSAPDFAEENRKAAREAILFTTQVEVPAA